MNDPLGNATTALDTAFDLLAAAADILNQYGDYAEDTGPNDAMRLAMEISEFLEGRLR